MNREFGGSLKLSRGIAQGGGLSSRIIDTKDTNGLTFAIQYGTIGATGTTFTAKLLHGSATNALATVASTDYAGSPANAVPAPGARVSDVNHNVIKKISYKGNKRYVQLQLTQSATGTPITVIAISNPLSKPV